MIYSVRGKVIAKDLSMVAVECNGVGYSCRATLNTLSKIGNIGTETFLLTYLNVREDCVELFGFYDTEELNCFKMLISVSGVGPKVALAILSDITPQQFALIVATSDIKSITKTKGVGPKVAQRIVLELKDKISKEQLSSDTSDTGFSQVMSGSNASEAISALVVLGYSQSEAASVVSKLDPALSVEDLIRCSLKEIGKFGK